METGFPSKRRLENAFSCGNVVAHIDIGKAINNLCSTIAWPGQFFHCNMIAI